VRSVPASPPSVEFALSSFKKKKNWLSLVVQLGFFRFMKKKSGLNYSHANNCSKKSYKILPQISNFTSTRKKAINKDKKLEN